MLIEKGKLIKTKEIGDCLVLGQLTEARYLLFNYEHNQFVIVENMEEDLEDHKWIWTKQLYLDTALDVFNSMLEYKEDDILLKTRLF